MKYSDTLFYFSEKEPQKEKQTSTKKELRNYMQHLKFFRFVFRKHVKTTTEMKKSPKVL